MPDSDENLYLFSLFHHDQLCVLDFQAQNYKARWKSDIWKDLDIYHGNN